MSIVTTSVDIYPSPFLTDSNMRVSQPVRSCSSLLAAINPQHTATIELEDMVKSTQKSILQRIPPSLRDVIRGIFQRFIFEQRSFEMTNEEFIAAYQRTTAGQITTKVPSVSPIRKTRQHQVRASCCNESSQSRSSFVTRECTPAHSPVPRYDTYDRSGSQSPLDTSYTEIHEKRKEIRKQLDRKDLVTAVRVDSRLQMQGRTPVLIVKLGPKSTASKGSVAKERDVRRRHRTVFGGLEF